MMKPDIFRQKHTQYFRSDKIPLHVIIQSDQNAAATHNHDFSELVIVTGGKALHIIDKQEYPVITGDVFLVNPKQNHSYSQPEGFSLINILFDWDNLQLPLHDLKDIPGYHALFTIEPYYRERHQFQSRLHLTLSQLSKAQSICEKTKHELESTIPGCDFAALGYFIQLIVYLSRCYSESNTFPVQTVLKLGKVISYLECNYTKPITVAEISEAACMSTSSLYRAFVESIGFSPIDYLIRIRLKHACSLLQDTKKDISFIAFETGFKDSNYFSRQFKRIMNCTPREYRKRNT